MTKRILIVDDDRNIRGLIRKVLEREGKYEVAEAEDGKAAEEKLAGFRPDLVVLDIQMPGEGGYETCMHIRSLAGRKKIKIVGVSGVSGKIGDAIMTALGADYFFEKPFNNSQFTHKIEELLEEVEA
ncbi:MAG: response regulator [Candidatus Omnitrophica bacterium]|nr:response regulator [Candidatus Omnitrophota bacterium]